MFFFFLLLLWPCVCVFFNAATEVHATPTALGKQTFMMTTATAFRSVPSKVAWLPLFRCPCPGLCGPLLVECSPGCIMGCLMKLLVGIIIIIITSLFFSSTSRYMLSPLHRPSLAVALAREMNLLIIRAWTTASTNQQTVAMQ